MAWMSQGGNGLFQSSASLRPQGAGLLLGIPLSTFYVEVSFGPMTVRPP